MTGFPDRVIALLKAGQLDAALIALPYDMSGLAHAHVSDDELLAALPSSHPLANQAAAPAASRPSPTSWCSSRPASCCFPA